jgi:hypothetical protein
MFLLGSSVHLKRPGRDWVAYLLTYCLSNRFKPSSVLFLPWHPPFTFVHLTKILSFLPSLSSEKIVNLDDQLGTQVNLTKYSARILYVFQFQLERLGLQPHHHQRKLTRTNDKNIHNAYSGLERFRTFMAHLSHCPQMDVHHSCRNPCCDSNMSPRSRLCIGLRGSGPCSSSSGVCRRLLRRQVDIVVFLTSTLLDQRAQNPSC